MNKELLQQALKVLHGCLEHPDTADAIAALEAAITKPTPAEYAQGYCEGLNDGCKPAQPAESAWQTIQTAPKDGSVIVIFCPNSLSTVKKAKWQPNYEGASEGRWSPVQGGFVISGVGVATHWMPLHTPPVTPPKDKP